MTTKKQINHRAIQEVCHLYNGILYSINLCHTLSILLFASSALFTKSNKGWNERKEDLFVYQRR